MNEKSFCSFLDMESLGCQDYDQPLQNTSLENNDGAQVNEQTGVEVCFVIFRGASFFICY